MPREEQADQGRTDLERGHFYLVFEDREGPGIVRPSPSSLTPKSIDAGDRCES